MLQWSRGGGHCIAVRFFDGSINTRTFKRGMDACNNPSFYRQLGKDPEQLMAAALEFLAKKFRLSARPKSMGSPWLGGVCPGSVARKY